MRIRGLDFLRGIAILGVLLRHSEMSNALTIAGGYGVDLFFVLSGFLVSGLLFREYKKNGSANVGRFLIRRGFKIYPAFYIFLLVTVLVDTFYFQHPVPGGNIFTEALFLQSYGVPVRFHTWSLSVEEHFYVILALLVFVVLKFKLLDNFKTGLLSITGIIVLVFSLRLAFCIQNFDSPKPFFGTHLRADGLFTGVLLSYVWYFRNDLIQTWRKKRNAMKLLAFLLIAPVFILRPDHFFISTIGFNLMHLGFAILIILFGQADEELSVFRRPLLKQISWLVCFIGINSYSIYLWHLTVKDVLYSESRSPLLNDVIFFAGAIAIGLVSAFLIEKQSVKIGNRYFPAS
jgi:peptidoglycan/LPS O-acetylase OafA/YrhL